LEKEDVVTWRRGDLEMEKEDVVTWRREMGLLIWGFGDRGG
jgi:hypothetical protein